MCCSLVCRVVLMNIVSDAHRSGEEVYTEGTLPQEERSSQEGYCSGLSMCCMMNIVLTICVKYIICSL